MMMTFRCIFKLYVYIFIVSAAGSSSPVTCNRINVVLFFAESSKVPTSAAGIKFLEMQEMARVKVKFINCFHVFYQNFREIMRNEIKHKLNIYFGID
ncbi:hypothetical protein JTB14_035912 [Gonioctena quinquepunctata]|nr:hypothetical protein JTB14_035912 [Gonioctena quinquepunctata]